MKIYFAKELTLLVGALLLLFWYQVPLNLYLFGGLLLKIKHYCKSGSIYLISRLIITHRKSVCYSPPSDLLKAHYQCERTVLWFLLIPFFILLVLCYVEPIFIRRLPLKIGTILDQGSLYSISRFITARRKFM